MFHDAEKPVEKTGALSMRLEKPQTFHLPHTEKE